MTRPRENPPIPFRRPAGKSSPGLVARPVERGGGRYADLQVTSNFSFLRGASHPGELVIAAKALGHQAIAITDRNTLAGIVRGHEEAKKEGIRFVVGCRLDPQEGPSLLTYPMNRRGYGHLCRLLSRGKMRAPKGECHFGFEEMLEHLEDQAIIIVPPRVIDACLEDHIAQVRKVAPGRVWLAAAWLYTGDDRARLNRLASLSARTGVPLVATNDVHYHAPERRALQDVVSCIREKTTLAKAGFTLLANTERHLKPEAEMERLFASWPQALTALNDVLELTQFSLDELAYNYPNEPVPKGKTPQQHLEALTLDGAAWRYPNGVPTRVKATLDKELSLIEELGYAQYFLTVHDIVAFARKEGILCQGRGSAANSAVCYCLGVTAVDPSQTSLLFERFLSRARKEPPDIDVDFEHERREEVIQYIYSRYGRHRAGLTATVITYRPRSAVREVGKAMGLSEDVTNALASTVWGSWGKELPEDQIRQAGLDLDDPTLRRTIALAHELLGFPRHLSQHVGGFVLTEDPLEELVPIGNAAMDDRTFIEWDKDDIDTLKILKVDVLALGMLTCIAKAFGLIEKHYGLDYTLATLPPEDPAVYEMLQRADAIGVFQVESRAQLNMLPRLKPACFYDLVIEVAIVRPGPIQGDMVHPYLRRRDGIEQVSYPSPSQGHGDADELERVLGRTLGVPLFQEQAMQIAIDAAKFTPDEANQLRKAMATFRRVGTIHTLQEKMVGRMVARGYDPDFAKRCFDQIKGFGEYGFPESHAASFALLVYASSWIKCHFPDVFCAAILNSQPMGFYAPAQLVRDARAHEVEVRPPDVNHSRWDNTLEEHESGGFAVRLGFRQLDGLAKEVMEAFVARRDDHWPSGDGKLLSSMEDCRQMGLSVPVLERLAAGDAFRSLGLDRRQALWAVRGLMSDAPADLFEAMDADPAGADAPVALPLMPLGEHVVADYQTQKLSLKAHPVSFLRERYAAERLVTAEDLFQARHGQRVRYAGVVLVRQKPGTAKGVVFMTLEDETGTANIVVWDKMVQRYRRVVMQARLVEVVGEVQRKDDIIHIVAHRLVDRTGDLEVLSTDTLPETVARADHVRSPLTGPVKANGAYRKQLRGRARRKQDLNADGIVELPLAHADEVKRPVEADTRIKSGERADTYVRVRRRPLSEAQSPKVQPREAVPGRGTHPRNVRVIPKSRDFH
ncbi:MAG: error-prone DNA polymerase [Devosiaceae bacterium]|nr:error-prone DNA polymerase [Devosiaceae bacterium MH13]